MTAETSAAINNLAAKSQSSMQSSTHSAYLETNTNKGEFKKNFSYFPEKK
jgi:hypothetical protein